MSTETRISHPMMRAFAAAVRANVPVLLWGDPGTGKTATINACGKAWGMHVESIVGSNREPSDFMGFPVEHTDTDGTSVTAYSTLSWAKRLADAGRALLFLDELTTCSPSVQKVMLRILQERVVGELQLPDTVSIVAAANPPGVAVDGWDLAAPVANRIMHLDWHFDSQAWLEGFVSNFEFMETPGLDAMLNDGSDQARLRAKALVAAFLAARPDLRNPSVPNDPALAGRGWPSPRSWTNAAAVLAELAEDDTEAMLLVTTGCVGEAAAIEFVAWVVSSDLYDPEAVIKDPSIVDWTIRPDRIFALMTSVTAIAQSRGDKATWEAVMEVVTKCAESGRPDLAYPSARSLMSSQPKAAKVPAGVVDAFGDLFEKMGRWAI